MKLLPSLYQLGRGYPNTRAICRTSIAPILTSIHRFNQTISPHLSRHLRQYHTFPQIACFPQANQRIYMSHLQQIQFQQSRHITSSSASISASLNSPKQTLSQVKIPGNHTHISPGYNAILTRPITTKAFTGMKTSHFRTTPFSQPPPPASSLSYTYHRHTLTSIACPTKIPHRTSIYIPDQKEFRYKVYKANRRRNQPKYSRVYYPFGDDPNYVKYKVSPRGKFLIRLMIFLLIIKYRHRIHIWILPNEGGWFGEGVSDDPDEDEGFSDLHEENEFRIADDDELAEFKPGQLTHPLAANSSYRLTHKFEQERNGAITSHIMSDPERTLSLAESAMHEMYPDTDAERRKLQPTDDPYIRN